MGSQVSLEGDTADGSGDGEPRPAQTTRSHLLCLSRAHNKFCLQLFQEYCKDGKRTGNFVLAPLGISIGLGLLHLGAKGTTQEEIAKALHLHEVAADQLLPAFAAIHYDTIKSHYPKGCVFGIALGLFAQSPIYLTPHYEDMCLHYQITRLKQADFRNRPDKARVEINQWAEERTNGRIKDVIPMGIIDRDTKILGLSGLYMKSLWLHPFDPRKTTDQPFQLPMKETLSVRMMCQQRLLRYGQHVKLDCEAVELPFANTYTTVLLLLPKKEDGIQKLETKLDRKSLEAIYDSLADEYVEVHFPRFRYELGLTLGDKLQRLGMKTMFTMGKSDFSNINSSRDLYVSRIFHHVYMEFDEGVPNGSASGSGPKNSPSGTEEGNSSQEDDKKTFRCDHPFMFVIRDDRTGAISFVGRVVRPLLAS
ncbi:hypothetical protein LSH36_331g01013 [Paralvinella palmiformis]|uniref:Serpin domain-containing protein n=1 Tax=Paralvinella palmiformis TaxID=53620 RepID=A0AAD9N085_9ANNE|nr:hypothetical protein LSH36_331g01013 [Paralvinella palmiformis]